jgi:hypothetical protein
MNTTSAPSNHEPEGITHDLTSLSEHEPRETIDGQDGTSSNSMDTEADSEERLVSKERLVFMTNATSLGLRNDALKKRLSAHYNAKVYNTTPLAPSTIEIDSGVTPHPTPAARCTECIPAPNAYAISSITYEDVKSSAHLFCMPEPISWMYFDDDKKLKSGDSTLLCFTSLDEESRRKHIMNDAPPPLSIRSESSSEDGEPRIPIFSQNPLPIIVDPWDSQDVEIDFLNGYAKSFNSYMDTCKTPCRVSARSKTPIIITNVIDKGRKTLTLEGLSSAPIVKIIQELTSLGISINHHSEELLPLIKDLASKGDANIQDLGNLLDSKAFTLESFCKSLLVNENGIRLSNSIRQMKGNCNATQAKDDSSNILEPTYIKVQVRSDQYHTHLTQPDELDSVFARYGLNSCELCPTTPWSEDLDLPTAGESTVSTIHYQELCIVIAFLSTWSRPDLRLVSSELLKYFNDPKTKHWAAGLKVLRYIKGTRNVGLLFRQNDIGPKETVCLSYANSSICDSATSVAAYLRIF